MRMLGAVCAVFALTGCGALDQLALNRAPALDPNKIYLGMTDKVTMQRRDVEKYTCRSGTMVCMNAGISYECGCKF